MFKHAMSCTDATGNPIDLAILQKGDAVTVFRAVPNPDGGAPQQKPVKRIRLVEGAKLSKASG